MSKPDHCTGLVSSSRSCSLSPTFFPFRSRPFFFGWLVRPGPALFLVLPDDPDLVPIFFRAVGWAFSGSLSLPKERHPKVGSEVLVRFKKIRGSSAMCFSACVCYAPSVHDFLQENNVWYRSVRLRFVLTVRCVWVPIFE